MNSSSLDAQQQLLHALYESHAADLERFVTRLTGDHKQAEDIIQEALFRAWQRPEVLARPEAAVRAWLFTVARNLVVDHWRSARNRHEIGTDQPPEESQTDATDRVLDSWLISEALSVLSAEHRQILLHGYYRSLSVREISAELGIPEGTVKSRMHYALRAMKLALQERGVTQ
ncbi:sigma-70 family RNA polymerase sigma factor [Psychromicrobium sp. YIM B11713]|uniref:sigma-70 family RNA polymerase sigma factor n=1 Tax=Psychromicrobium sp. YIM B11713 TaxID=3145233 RepID=UPI00374E831C